MIANAQVHVTSVKVVCPTCNQALKYLGTSENFSPSDWNEITQRLDTNKHIACPHCHVVMKWPDNPFKKE